MQHWFWHCRSHWKIQSEFQLDSNLHKIRVQPIHHPFFARNVAMLELLNHFDNDHFVVHIDILARPEFYYESYPDLSHENAVKHRLPKPEQK